MRTLTRLGTCAAALTVAIAPVTTFEVVKAAADDGTRVPLKRDLRRCDFSLVPNSPQEYRPLTGSGAAVIHVTDVGQL